MSLLHSYSPNITTLTPITPQHSTFLIQGGRGQLTVYYTGTQSNSLIGLKTLGTLIRCSKLDKSIKKDIHGTDNVKRT